jgi:hypothetical protein
MITAAANPVTFWFPKFITDVVSQFATGVESIGAGGASKVRVWGLRPQTPAPAASSSELIERPVQVPELLRDLVVTIVSGALRAMVLSCRDVVLGILEFVRAVVYVAEYNVRDADHIGDMERAAGFSEFSGAMNTIMTAMVTVGELLDRLFVDMLGILGRLGVHFMQVLHGDGASAARLVVRDLADLFIAIGREVKTIILNLPGMKEMCKFVIKPLASAVDFIEEGFCEATVQAKFIPVKFKLATATDPNFVQFNFLNEYNVRATISKSVVIVPNSVSFQIGRIAKPFHRRFLLEGEGDSSSSSSTGELSPDEIAESLSKLLSDRTLATSAAWWDDARRVRNCSSDLAFHCISRHFSHPRETEREC